MTTAETIKTFEKLVEELIKDDPNESDIKNLMEKLNMDYQMDSVNRIAAVLEKMNTVVFESKHRKGDYDLR